MAQGRLAETGPTDGCPERVGRKLRKVLRQHEMVPVTAEQLRFRAAEIAHAHGEQSSRFQDVKTLPQIVVRAIDIFENPPQRHDLEVVAWADIEQWSSPVAARDRPAAGEKKPILRGQRGQRENLIRRSGFIGTEVVGPVVLPETFRRRRRIQVTMPAAGTADDFPEIIPDIRERRHVATADQPQLAVRFMAFRAGEKQPDCPLRLLKYFTRGQNVVTCGQPLHQVR